MNFFASQTIRRRRDGGGSTPSVDSQVANYASRLAAHGRTMTTAGSALVREVFQSAVDNGSSVNSAWLAGTSVNVSKNKLLNLVESKSNLKPTTSLHASSTMTNGMIALRMENDNQGLTTEDGNSLLSNSGAYSVLLMYDAIGDPVDNVYFSEAVLPVFSSGNCGVIGNHQATNYPKSQGVTGIANGGNATSRESQIGPAFVWLVFDGVGNWQFHHVADDPYLTQTVAGNLESTAVFIANGLLPSGGFNTGGPGTVGLLGIMRFDGAMSTAQRRNVFSRIWRKWRAIVDAGLIVGNSVTISGVSDARTTWPRQTSRWGLLHDFLFVRRAQGAQRLPKFAPIGYTLPSFAPYADPVVSEWPINIYDYFGANYFINDEQQNTVPGQNWATFLHCHNSFASHLATLNDIPIKAVCCTQMAHIPLNFGGDYLPLSYPGFGDSNWRKATFAARAATLADFNNVPTAIADVWTAFNLGNTVSWGGLPSNPATDFANGNPVLFADAVGHKDAQHPNQSGHDVLANNVYIPAIQYARSL